MNHRVITRCAVASAGALLFFTVALATPSNCRYEHHGLRVSKGACSDPMIADAGAARSSEALIAVSIMTSRKAVAGPMLEGRSVDASPERRCWGHRLIRTCVFRGSAP